MNAITARYLNNKLVLTIKSDLIKEFYDRTFSGENEIYRLDTRPIDIQFAKILLNSVNLINLAVSDTTKRTTVDIARLLKDLLGYTKFSLYQKLEKLGISPTNNKLYVNNISIDLPEFLLNYIDHFSEDDNAFSAFLSFMSRALRNPIKSAAISFVEYVISKNLPITPKGYAVMYKSVMRKNNKNKYDVKVQERIIELYESRKKAKKGVKVMVVSTDDNRLEIFGSKNYKVAFELGLLSDLYDRIKGTSQSFTDHHSGTTHIVLNEPFPKKPLPVADDVDLVSACSYGLHLGSEQYVRNFHTSHDDSEILYCLVDPMLVINSSLSEDKIRTRQYFPFDIIDKKQYNLTSDAWKIENRILNISIDQYEEVFDKVKISNKDIMSSLTTSFLERNTSWSKDFKQIDTSLEEEYGYDAEKMEAYYSNDGVDYDNEYDEEKMKDHYNDDDEYDEDNTNDPY